MISGGYILQPRKIDESAISKSPPHVREIWGYLLRTANQVDEEFSGIVVKRGQLITSYAEIISALSWKIGFRKMYYKPHHCETAMKTMMKAAMITATKTAHKIVVTICNYDYYQDLKTYDNRDDSRNESRNDNRMITADAKFTSKRDDLSGCIYDDCEVVEEISEKQPNFKEEREVYKEKEEKERTKEREEKEINQEKEETLPPKSKKIHEYKNSLLSEIAEQFSELDYQHIEIAKAFQSLFRNNLINAGASTKVADNMKGTSIDDIRLIIEADGYTVEDLRQVFDVLRTNDFWKKNVLSTKALRKQMTRLKLEKHGADKKPGKTGENRDFHELAEIIHRITAD